MPGGWAEKSCSGVVASWLHVSAVPRRSSKWLKRLWVQVPAVHHCITNLPCYSGHALPQQLVCSKYSTYEVRRTCTGTGSNRRTSSFECRALVLEVLRLA
jgi:hypothetical protein